MKRLMFIVALLFATVTVSAQSCETLLLPYFGSQERLAEASPEKVALKCALARVAFYESDTIPAGAAVHTIAELNEYSHNQLPENYVVDLSTLSYYSYEFQKMQLIYFNNPEKVICYPTPSSTHPYLVLRSLNEMHRMAEALLEKEF